MTPEHEQRIRELSAVIPHEKDSVRMNMLAQELAHFLEMALDRRKSPSTSGREASL